MQENIYSNAFNFESYLESGVDPRTGQYTVQFQLANISSHCLNGPQFPLNISYSPLAQNNLGFGIGWSLSLSNLDLVSKKLSLSNGQSFLINGMPPGSNQPVSLKDQKLLDVRLIKIDDETFEIIYKSGFREILKCWGSETIARTQFMVQENGLSIEFKRDYINSDGQYWITSIVEVEGDQQILANITYGSSGATSIDFPLDDGNQARCSLVYSNEKLTEFTLPFQTNTTRTNSDQSSYQLSYSITNNGYTLLDQLTHPTGQLETINYDQTGHQLPNQQTVPYVIGHILYPGTNQPVIQKTYSYSSYNFLGFGKLNNWNDGEDNLYLVTGDYEYSSEERWLNETGEVVQRIERTYNKFHLLHTETRSQSTARVQKTLEYNEDPSKNFYEQPAYLQLPKTVETRYFRSNEPENDRTELEVYSYDDSGNILSYQMPYGVCVQNTFYPAGGETGCPASPSGLVQYLKSQQVIPASTQDGETPRLITCTYEQVGDMVVRSQDLMSSGLTRVYSHFNESSSIESRGRIQRIQEWKTNQPQTVTTKEFSYDSQDGVLVETISTIGFDQTQKQIIQHLGQFTENVLRTVDEDGVETVFQYDILNRLERAQVAPGTDYVATKTLAYTIGDGQNTVTTTNPKGVCSTHYYDNLGRLIRRTQQMDQGEPFQETHLWAYDSLGRVVSETEKDWFENAIISTNQTLNSYNDWGEIDTVTHSDGRIEIDEFDPIQLKRTQAISGLEYQEIYYNTQQQVLGTHYFDAQGVKYAQTTNTYDGFLRLREEVNIEGGVTIYSYDSFDRVEQQFLPEGLSVSIEFESFSREALRKRITMNGVELGSRENDGLGRVKVEQSNGFEIQYSYSDSVLHPTQMQTASATSQVSYNPSLRHITNHQILEDENLTTQYELDSGSGLLQASETNSDRCEFNYTSLGLLGSQTQSHGSSSRTTSWSYSLLGKVMSEIDYFGQRVDWSYDTFGRLTQKIWMDSTGTQVGSLQLNYDGFSRLDSYVYEGLHSCFLNVTLAYDERGNEQYRICQSPSNEIKIDQSFNASRQLIQRVKTVDQIIHLTEEFEYDQLGRLIRYTNMGDHPPLDEYGLGIQEETYSFNNLSSLSSVHRRFVNGEENLSNFSFDNTDHPQLVTQVTNTHPNYPTLNFEYDECGNLISQGHNSYNYDAQNKLISVSTLDGNTINYEYNSEDTLSRVQKNGGQTTHLWYAQSTLTNESTESHELQYHRVSNTVLGGCTYSTQTESSDSNNHWLVVTNESGTPVSNETYQANTSTTSQDYRFTPYGQRSGVDESEFSPPLGFNGERFDGLGDLYHLGGGFRAFSPSMMRFLSADPLSPFEEGGLNAYAYAMGDPINLSDPSGQSALDTILRIGGALVTIGSIVAIPFTGGSSAAIAVSVISTALSVTAKGLDVAAQKQLAKGNVDQAARLKNASRGLNAANAILSIANLGRAAYKPWGTAATRSGKSTYTTQRKLVRADKNRSRHTATFQVHQSEDAISGNSFSFQVAGKEYKTYSKPRAGFQLKTTRTPTNFEQSRFQRLKSSSDFTSAGTRVLTKVVVPIAKGVLSQTLSGAVEGVRESEDGGDPQPLAPLATSTGMAFESEETAIASSFVQAGLLSPQEDQNTIAEIRSLDLP